MKTKKHILPALAGLILLATTAAAAKVSPETHKQNVAIIAEAKRVGFIKELKPAAHEVVVVTELWQRMEYKQKGGLVAVVSEYFEHETNLGHVTVRCNLTNKKLATYGTLGGLKIIQ